MQHTVECVYKGRPRSLVHHNEPVLKAIAKYRGVMRGKNNKEATGVLHPVPGWIRGGDRASVSLSHHLTLILILPLSSPTDFSTRIFSSFRSRCTMSVRCEEDNIHSDIAGSNTWIQATYCIDINGCDQYSYKYSDANSGSP